MVKVSSEANWEQHRPEIIAIAKRGHKDMLVEIKMDGQDRYWIIDVDYSIIDDLGQVREIGCIQIDVGNAKRLGIKFAHNDHSHMDYPIKSGNDKGRDEDNGQPIIIHAAVPGGIERYIYMLCDDIRLFPIALHPVQLRLIPVSEKYQNFALELARKYADIRIEIDDRAESVSKRIKLAHEDLVPEILVVGEKEQKAGWQDLERLAKEIRDKSRGVPFLPFSWPARVSQQLRRK